VMGTTHLLCCGAFTEGEPNTDFSLDNPVGAGLDSELKRSSLPDPWLSVEAKGKKGLTRWGFSVINSIHMWASIFLGPLDALKVTFPLE